MLNIEDYCITPVFFFINHFEQLDIKLKVVSPLLHFKSHLFRSINWFIHPRCRMVFHYHIDQVEYFVNTDLCLKLEK